MFKFDSKGKVIGVHQPYIAKRFLQHDSNCVAFNVFHKNQPNQPVGFYNLTTGAYINKITDEYRI